MQIRNDAFLPHASAHARVGHTHVLVHHESDDPSASHSLLVPAGWFVAPRCPGDDRIGQPRMITMYLAAPHAAAPTLGVSRLRVATELDAEDLVVHRCALEGWTVLEVRTVDGIDGPVRQLASFRESPEPRLRVSTWQVDGGRLFQVDAVAAAMHWPRCADALLLCGPSFALRHPTRVRRLGPTRVVQWSGFGVEVPSEWELAAHGDHRVRMVAALGDGHRAALEIRRVDLAQASQPARLGARIDHAIRRLGGRAVTVRGVPGERGFEVGVHRGADRLALRATVVSHDALAVDVITIAPSSERHLDGWLRVRRAHTLAVASVAGRTA